VNVSLQLKELRAALPDGAFEPGCPSRKVLDHVSSKWGMLVLIVLADGTMRWGELRRAVEGVSEKMLSQTLQLLERDGLIRREARPVVPPHVEYSLTNLGQDLVTLLLPLMTWMFEHSPEIISGQAAQAAKVTEKASVPG
jgi:DNA-binding HxlR family transcriptional regulator